MKALREAGEIVDPRDAQLERLKRENAELKKRVAARDQKLAEAAEFKTSAISRLAAQHAEIEQLREAVAARARVRALPNAPTHAAMAPFGRAADLVSGAPVRTTAIRGGRADQLRPRNRVASQAADSSAWSKCSGRRRVATPPDHGSRSLPHQDRLTWPVPYPG
jgi:hypothetical protein